MTGLPLRRWRRAPACWWPGPASPAARCCAALEPLGVRLTISDDDPAALQRLTPPTASRRRPPTTAVAQIADYALVVTSPGFPPTAPVLAAAAAAGRADLG